MKSYDDAVAFHGHSCPGLALGYRVSLRALKEFRNRAEDEELVAIVENNSCAVDAIQLMTGCTFGKGNLVFRDYGKQVYTFVSRPSGRSMRIAIDWEKVPETKRQQDLWKKFRQGDRSSEVLEFVSSRKAAKTTQILEADETMLMTVLKGRHPLPEEAEIYPSRRCERCGEKTAEPRARIKEGKILCIPCFETKEKTKGRT